MNWSPVFGFIFLYRNTVPGELEQILLVPVALKDSYSSVRQYLSAHFGYHFTPLPLTLFATHVDRLAGEQLLHNYSTLWTHMGELVGNKETYVCDVMFGLNNVCGALESTVPNCDS